MLPVLRRQVGFPLVGRRVSDTEVNRREEFVGAEDPDFESWTAYCAFEMKKAVHDQRIKDIADRVLWLEDGKLKTTVSMVMDPVGGMTIESGGVQPYAPWRHVRVLFEGL